MKLSRLITPLALVAGFAMGGVALHLWTHHLRFRELANESWSPRDAGNYAGSESCRECHERFYELWEPSHHGKAMQPATRDLLQTATTPLAERIDVSGVPWSVDRDTLHMVEHADTDKTTYAIVHAMGGKNVFFFLTPMERGRLQVLPLAYDVRRQEWFNTTQAMVRHFNDAEAEDEAIDWRDPMLTFNTACYNCHVSQLDRNYDPDTDTYHTTWREPGINCEACHGPSDEHARVCRAVPKGTEPQDMRTVKWSDFTVKQANDACAPCHAKARAIKTGFCPGDRFFDFYDLTCLEDRDFYPDGRDLGENYTQTGWLMSPCAQSGLLDCMHCHTSSGRYRFKDENPNGACLPCHARRVSNIEAHSRHAAGAEAPHCIDCHMPMTEFGRMRRSDHSMRPPSPAAGAAFGSPVACILCHDDESADWAAQVVGEWHSDPVWQPRILHEGKLVQSARKEDGSQLPAILAYIDTATADPVVVTSLIRLLAACPDSRKWPVLRRATRHPHPLVRGAAATGLRDDLASPATRGALYAALTDDLRVVRVHAAWSLARLPENQTPPQHRQALKDATAELLDSFDVFPDTWGSHYNRGNYLSDRGDLDAALTAYRRSIELRDDVVMSYVNAAVVASRLGHLRESIALLKTAHEVEPEHGAVNLNLGLALAEARDTAGAAKHLRLAIKDPGALPQAAFNLAVLVADRKPDEAIRLCALAAKAAPDDPRNAYTHAFYLNANGQTDEAITVLEALIGQHRRYADAWLLLGSLYVQAGQHDNAIAHYKRMERAAFLPTAARRAAARERASIPP